MKRTAISRRPSRKKRDFDAEYAAVLPSVLARGCEWSGYTFDNIAASLGVVSPEDHQCRGRLIGHHAKGRTAHDANEPHNLRCLCDFHHRFVHGHGEWSREVGLMLSRIS